MNRKEKHKRRPKPQLGRQEKINSWTIKILAYTLGLLGVVSCVEFNNMDNNLQGIELFLVFGLIGLCISAMVMWPLKTKFKYVFTQKDDSFITGCLLIGFTFGTPAVANYYNRTNPGNVSCSVYQIIKMDYSHGKRGRGYHHLYVDIGQSEERLKVDHETWHRLDGQGKVELCLANGGLSFDFIESINRLK
jgi:hypothetical protein